MINNGTLTFASLLAQDKIIEIPIIQRDYVQGRKEAGEVRSMFMQTLHETLSTAPQNLSEALDLDFVYGSLQGPDQDTFWPLDGQQRLTTLFLLHWYLANQDGETEDFQKMVLKNGRPRFTYQTRSSSSMFFKELASTVIDLKQLSANSEILSDALKNSKWFFVSLGYDPTVQSALTMLDAIHRTFGQSCGFYSRLIGQSKPYITFQFLNLEEFGLSDDLYIKMNARGKPLTAFENFKARFEQTVGQLCDQERMELHGSNLTLREYISRKLDTDWADLFWDFCDSDISKIDDQKLEFFRSVIGVLFPMSATESEADNVSKVIKTLREDSFIPTHMKYKELGCFSETLIKKLIVLMNRLCKDGVFKPYLQDSAYYDERHVFSLALQRLATRGREPSGLTYEPAVQFFAWCLYLIKEEGQIDSDALFQWTRLVHNLAVNSRIDDVRVYVDVLNSLMELVEHSADILTYLANADEGFRLQGFYRPQIREERLKAQLILKSGSWRDLIHEAEKHPYFQGQIEFILDFSGVLDYFIEHGDSGWSDKADANFQISFSKYLQKANALFDKDGVIALDDYLFERALLVKGDYLLKSSVNHSFLKNGLDRNISWKRLLRGSEYKQDENRSAEKRRYIKLLMDEVVIGNIEGSLTRIIQSVAQIDEWRQMIIEYPEVIGYCERSFIRRGNNDEQILLLKRTQTNGAHLELRSNNLYLSQIRQMSPEQLTPFKRADLRETYSADDLPEIQFFGMYINESPVRLLINYPDGEFRIQVWSTDENALIRMEEHFSNYISSNVLETGEVFFTVAEEELMLVLQSVLKHLAKLDRS